MGLETRLISVGDAALLLELGTRLELSLAQRAQTIAETLEADIAAGSLPGVGAIVPAYASVLVHFDPDRVDGAALAARLLDLSTAAPAPRPAATTHCFDLDASTAAAPDLALAMAACGLTRGALLRALADADLEVAFLGFAPGFAYLLGLPTALTLPRRATPRLQVARGSLATAGGQLAIFPCAMPSGWHVLGRVSEAQAASLFDPMTATPCLLQPRDRVRLRVLP